jgi:oxygen-independent coproporphyrinogen III oxidase
MSGIAVYVHVPFCAARCPYCDFATAPAATALRSRYLAALATEITREGAVLSAPRVRTVFFGGGTPSLLEPSEVDALGAALRGAFTLRPREVTLEVNPATLDRARLESWHLLGLTRVSLGAQSFSDRGLRALGRTHQVGDIGPAAAAVRSVGCELNLDLIFGWPGQSLAEWGRDLDAALALAPDHLSCYPLELALERDEGAGNWPGGWAGVERWRRSAAAAQPDDDLVAHLYELAEARLGRAGYRHYEIANWALPGKRCLHNLAYWRDAEWLGVGVGAHSHLAGVRSRNPGALVAYIERVERGAPRLVEATDDPAADGAMLALRLDTGLDLERYGRRFGVAAVQRVAAALAPLDGTLVRHRAGRVALTARGRLLGNEVFAELLPDRGRVHPSP